MPIQVNSPGWQVRGTAAARGSTRSSAEELPGLPAEFLSADSQLADQVVLQPAAASRAAAAGADGALDLSCDLDPEHTAILALRHPSGALTFARPVAAPSQDARGSSQVNFQVRLRQPATRGLTARAVKAIVIKVAKMAGDKGVSLVLPRLAEALENEVWQRRGLTEGWVRVAKETLTAGALAAATPRSPMRSLLLLHGSFSHTASAFRHLAGTEFLTRVAPVYDERMFGFDHFSISRSPEQNARALLESLPEQTTTFDVVTHGRGGLILRTLVERSKEFGDLSRRFKLGHAVLVASPNDGTPLAFPQRWEDTLGWLANVIEMFPDNPFTTGSALVANGLVWLANHALGDLPGLHAMDGEGDLIGEIQGSPGPPRDAYSALVSNYQPSGSVLQRLLDVGIDQLFGSANDLVVPSEGGWRIDRSSSVFIPSARIGCFGPGGNLPVDTVTHLNFFSQAHTVDFMANALLGRPQPLAAVDPRKRLPDRRLRQRGTSDAVSVQAQGKAVSDPTVARAQPADVLADEPTLRITVVNGDLTFEAETLLLGHYDATRLTGTEKIMDRLIGGTMDRSLAMGVYPVAIGSSQIFINNRPNLERGTFMPRPKAVLIAGLGEEGKLRAPDLVRSVRQAVIAWSQRLGEGKGTAPRTFDLASTLLGSGGTGVSAGQAARLIAEGVYQANMLLANEDVDSRSRQPAPFVSHLRFIELYLDRATDAWRALRLQEAARPGRYVIADAVQPGTGALERPADPGYRGAEFDFISVLGAKDPDGVPMICYTLDTRRARSEVRAQRAQSRLINELVATASNSQNTDQQIGRTLFGLLIPIELEAYLAGSGEVQIELDPQTAAIPWELLDTKRESDNDPPWAVKVNLLRKLRIREFRERVSDAGLEASALVIGEPECPPDFPRLYGARAEAIAVRDCLAGPSGLEPSAVTALISEEPTQTGPGARAVVNALFERPWRIMHIAGHGVPAASGTPAGVVLSNGTFLGPAEIESMRSVPELVFVNCCHLGAADVRQLLKTYNRAEFASGMAGSLISIGVRCVIAAGWAVDDEGARVFAEAFYSSLLRGNRFIVAVGEARLATYQHNPDQNTWAAYQCYGDPHWVFRQVASDPNRASARAAEDFSGLASAVALKLALERIIVEVRYQGADRAAKLESLQQLESKFVAKWGGRGDVAELFGEAFFEAGDIEAGITWYETAMTAPDGRGSLRAIEQLGNLRSRFAWELVDRAVRYLDAMKGQEKAVGTKGKGRAEARRARLEAERALRDAITRADALIEESLSLLGKAGAVEGTLERSSLLGSAYKRRALVNIAAGRRGQADRDLQLMATSYREAQKLGEKSGHDDLFYPLSNRLVAEVALNAGRGRWRSLDQEIVDILQKSLKASEPDFWSVVAAIELDQYQALAQRRLAAVRTTLEKAYADLHRRVRSTKMWASVYDTACLTLPGYAARATGKEKAAAETLLVHLRAMAYPPSE